MRFWHEYWRREDDRRDVGLGCRDWGDDWCWWCVVNSEVDVLGEDDSSGLVDDLHTGGAMDFRFRASSTGVYVTDVFVKAFFTHDMVAWLQHGDIRALREVFETDWTREGVEAVVGDFHLGRCWVCEGWVSGDNC